MILQSHSQFLPNKLNRGQVSSQQNALGSVSLVLHNSKTERIAHHIVPIDKAKYASNYLQDNNNHHQNDVLYIYK